MENEQQVMDGNVEASDKAKDDDLSVKALFLDMVHYLCFVCPGNACLCILHSWRFVWNF